MIAQVDCRLMHWAEWVRMRSDGGLGYPKKSIEYRMYRERIHEAGTKTSFVQIIPTDEEAEEMEKLIRIAPEHYKQIIIAKYLCNYTDQTTAKEIRCGTTAVRKYLDECHVWLAARLNIQIENKLAHYD